MNISLIVNDSEAEQCVKALHHSFFESGDLSELTVDGENREIGNGSAMKLNNVWRPFATFFFPGRWSVWTNTGRWISEWFSFAIVSRKLTINPSTHSQWFFWFPNKHIYWPFPSVRLVWISMQMQHLLVLRTQVELHLIFYYKDTSWVAFTFLKKKMMFWLNGLAMSELWNNSQEPSKIDGALFSYMVFITCGGDTSFLTFFIFVPPNWSRSGCWYFAKHSNNLLIFEHVMQCCQIWL